MGFFGWVFFGLIIGFIAKAIHPGKDPRGWIKTILIGVVGSVLGGWIGTLFGIGDVDGYNIRSFILAIGGSVLLLWLLAKYRNRKK